ncbi:asparagine synthase-related protein [Asticcacaulis sp. SL142]|uniref:asparagine synthase-related protein n=1 Tax=Asticcacaulis sp. SL142 TaxID=2995155 RepID=UPI00226CC6C5|nr:asparagine synthetase B family protein [Asticcacaulis sp. SL142]WAC49788.1 asparagine synthase-related protein [Asticcacaulis sp. SL142]
MFKTSPEGDGEFHRLCHRAKTFPDTLPAFSGHELAVFTQGRVKPLPLHNERGVVLGEMFTAGPIRVPVPYVDANMSDRIVASRGSWLIGAAWGRYLLCLMSEDGRTLTLMRDPSGGLDCYYWRRDGLIIITSSPEMASDITGIPAGPDWTAIATQLIYSNPKAIETGLLGVRELLPGTRLDLTATTETLSTVWTPWTFADTSNQIRSPSEAVKVLDQTLSSTLRAWAQIADHALVELSGGLDSSIIAAGLSSGPAQLSCLNLRTETPDADESDYATELAEAFLLPLTVATLAPALTLNIPRRRTFRPSLDVLQQATNAQFRQAAKTLHVDSIFTGAGGDGVFCFLKNAAPVTDALLSYGPGPDVLKALNDLTQLHQCTLWTAASLALRKLVSPAKSLSRVDLTFLTPEMAAVPTPVHPWSDTGSHRTLPGKAEHVLSLIAAQRFRDNFSRDDIAPVIAPLLSQPVMEACLRIPTWMWIDGGRNRSCARDAFQNRLPPRVLARRSKGNFMIVYTDAYHRHREALHDLLTGGALARQGVVDTKAISGFMSQPLRLHDNRFLKLFELAKIEGWLASWTDPPY